MAVNKNNGEAFPWHLGVYDAHCHPTDTMSSIETIQNMKAQVLTVMATRAEDQELVSDTAEKYSVRSADPSQWQREECIIPCFGWHPWFSYQMYLTEDIDPESNMKEQGSLTGDKKIAHYKAILQPSRETPSEEDIQTYLSLPDPTPFSTFLSHTRQYLHQHPFALIGEIGLDRSFRIPQSWTNHQDLWSQRDATLTPGGREGRRLTPFRTSPAHQKKIFKLQLQLAAETQRAVSVHGVQAHGLVLEVLSSLWKGHEKPVISKRERKKRGQDHPAAEAAIEADSSTSETTPEKGAGPTTPYPPRICLHSYSGNISNFKQYLHPSIPVHIFASFSTAINLSDALDGETPKSFEEMVATVPDTMLLVESDLHTAGEEMDRRLEDIVRRVCWVKGWGLEEGVRQLAGNWRRFVFGEE